jgi:hypothetical protein
MDYINTDKLLFVLANQGAGGYKLGRIIACLDNVYWYSNELNGNNPYNVFYNNIVNGKNISPYHFDRLYNNINLPVIGERLERYFNLSDYDLVYSRWNEYMNTIEGLDKILNNNYLLYVLHENPSTILSRFPNSKIINLIDSDINFVVDRYIETTALFPICINNIIPAPWYNTLFNQKLIKLCKICSNPTYRDYWAYITYNTKYFTEYEIQYRKYVSSIVQPREELVHKNVLNITWDSMDIVKLIDFTKSTLIDVNYNLLIK